MLIRKKTLLQAIDNAAMQAVENASTLRSDDTIARLGLSHDGERDLDVIYGYDQDVSFKDYQEKYRRIGYANRIVAGIPRSCWRDGAVLLSEPPEDGEDDKVINEDDMRTLTQQGMFKSLERADTLNRLGNFSVMYVGLPGDPDTEAGSASGNLEDVFFSQYDQDSVVMSDFERDKTSPRYGKPNIYTLTTTNRVTDDSGSVTSQKQTIRAHWTRIVHMAEGSLTNDLVGVPALQPINDALDNYMKVIGGTSESFFRNAMRAFFVLLEDKANLRGDTKTGYAEQAQKFINKARNFLYIKGAKDVKMIPTAIPDPTPSIKALLQEFSAASGIPLRKLTGEGAGQLAGNEDKLAYDVMIDDRKTLVCEEWLRNTLDILAMANLMSDTKDAFIKWPIQEATDEKEEAEIAKLNAETAMLEAQIELLGMTQDDPAVTTEDENDEDDLTE